MGQVIWHVTMSLDGFIAFADAARLAETPGNGGKPLLALADA